MTALLLDADGVLQRSAVSWRDGLGALLPAGADADAFLRAFLAVERTFLVRDGDLAAVRLRPALPAGGKVWQRGPARGWWDAQL